MEKRRLASRLKSFASYNKKNKYVVYCFWLVCTEKYFPLVLQPTLGLWHLAIFQTRHRLIFPVWPDQTGMSVSLNRNLSCAILSCSWLHTFAISTAHFTNFPVWTTSNNIIYIYCTSRKCCKVGIMPKYLIKEF